ncbi:MAG: aspartate kinase [Verrucomicrobia bacterium]|nr:aspartate kinase [Verrucomicrobiota bacterium]MCH8510727.1 aspartate kinase [Kiritimatiellia bacterium]
MKPLLVQKYGGSSVADAECMRRVADRIRSDYENGNDVVVVVSAMGKSTDKLIALAREVHADPNDREYDQLLSTGEQISISILAMALHHLGVKAVSMTGAQAGIRTDASHTKAKITGIDPFRVREKLDQGHVVIVAGFQGMNPASDVATLGRGGSDLTAVAMAAALKADRCQIFTDVDGVYTADPRVVPNARKLDVIAFDEMLELASLGAKVLQSRSVEFAKKYGVELEVLTSFERKPGTIVKEISVMEDVLVRGVAADKNQAKVTLRGLQDTPGVAALLFKAVAEAGVNVDIIVQNISEEGHTDISFTVPRDDVADVRECIKNLQDIHFRQDLYDDSIAKVTLVGVGMRSHTGVASRMFQVLAERNINIQMISTSEIRVSVVIDEADSDAACKALHTVFELDKDPVEVPAQETPL